MPGASGRGYAEMAAVQGFTGARPPLSADGIPGMDGRHGQKRTRPSTGCATQTGDC